MISNICIYTCSARDYFQKNDNRGPCPHVTMPSTSFLPLYSVLMYGRTIARPNKHPI